ncbi:MAG: hypothetical protein E7110_01790 [Bacteroidales bacterium]|nr:hypothetical protein [Bacteroidales bacterium]
MEQINIAEILKDCPSGMELDCAMYDNVQFDTVQDGNIYPIKINTPEGRISLSKYGCYSLNPQCKCIIFPKGKTTWEGFQRPFKDGDIITTDLGSVFILKEPNENVFFYGCYVALNDVSRIVVSCTQFCVKKGCRLATEEEKQKLFQAIKDNGYKWNAETKTLEKLPKFKVGDRVRNRNYKDYVFHILDITDKGYRAKELDADFPIIILFGSQENNYELVPNKFDITTLKPFDKVLIRDSKDDYWNIGFFSFKGDKHFCTERGYYAQCIPYEGNEHLLGTTNDCDEYFKNW